MPANKPVDINAAIAKDIKNFKHAADQFARTTAKEPWFIAWCKEMASK